MPILYPASNRFKYARSASDFRARRYAIQNPPPPPFDPSLLFAAMEQGAWYDPSDTATLYQDAAGTTPVTAVEQPVGRMLDKSGRGNHAVQTTATSRPVLKQDAGGQYYLRCDGIDDWMVTGTITPGTDKAQVFAGVRKLNNASTEMLMELSVNGDINPGSLSLAPSVASNYYASLRGGVLSARSPTTAIVAPVTSVAYISYELSQTAENEIKMRFNGTSATLRVASGQPGPAGTGNFLAYPIYLFRRGGTSLPFNGNFYGGIIRFGPNLPIETIQQTEAWMAAKTGVTL